MAEREEMIMIITVTIMVMDTVTKMDMVMMVKMTMKVEMTIEAEVAMEAEVDFICAVISIANAGVIKLTFVSGIRREIDASRTARKSIGGDLVIEHLIAGGIFERTNANFDTVVVKEALGVALAFVAGDAVRGKKGASGIGEVTAVHLCINCTMRFD